MAKDGRAQQQLSLFFLLAGVGHVLCQTTYVETGKSYTFETGETTATTAPESVLWKFNSDKLVEYEDGKLTWYQFKDEGVLDTKTGVLTLNRLQSGLYECEILMAGGKVDEKKYTIEVIDAVRVPEVKCNEDDKGEVTSLKCFLKPEVDGATFTWTGPGDQKTIGETLQITNETWKNANALFYCTAENPLGQKEKEFYLRDCDPEVGPHVNIGGIVGGLIVLLLVVVGVGVGLCICRKKQIGEITPPPESGTAEEGHPLTETNSNSNNCPKEEDKGHENSTKTGPDTIKTENENPSDVHDVKSENPKTEEAGVVPDTAKTEQDAPPTDQKTLSNGDADPPSDPPVSDTNETNEEDAEGQKPTEDDPSMLENSKPGKKDNDA